MDENNSIIPSRKSLVGDFPPGDGKIDNLPFLQCTFPINTQSEHRGTSTHLQPSRQKILTVTTHCICFLFFIFTVQKEMSWDLLYFQDVPHHWLIRSMWKEPLTTKCPLQTVKTTAGALPPAHSTHGIL
jgi:hypothetical protein